MAAPRSPRLFHLYFAVPLACAHSHLLAQSSDDAILKTVQVTAARAQGFSPNSVAAGSFRGADVMDVPSTVNVITREVLELQAAAGLYDAVRNTAGVTRQQNGGDTWDQLVIRGIAVENRTNYRLNGSVPIMNFSQVPMENKERVEVLKGASALYYGFTSPAGVVNFVSKRAGATPLTSAGVTLDDRGTAVANIDVGRRFGARQEFGVRLNAAGGALGTVLDRVDDGKRGFASAALDWRVNNRLLLKADLEYDHRKLTEQAGIALPAAVNGVIPLPHAVDPSKLVGPDIAKFDATSKSVALRADYALAEGWALTVEGGHAEVARERNLAIFRFTNPAAVASGAGRIAGNSQHLAVGSDMLRAELFGTAATGAIKHEITVGLSRTDKTQDPIYQRNYAVASQNLYRPSPIATITYSPPPTTPTTPALETRDTGLYALDRVEFSPQWQFIGGARRASYRSDQGANHYTADQTTPMAALIYKPLADLSFYASAAQGLEEGEPAPAGTVNQNERMAPGVSKQRELGMRWRAAGGMLLSAALFDINRPGYYTNAANRFVADGEQRYRGVELASQGQLSPRLAWQASAQLLRPEFREINDSYNGKLPENAAKQTASAFLSYSLDDHVPGLSLNAGSYHTGRRPVNDLNQAWLGGATLFAIGGRHISQTMGKRTTWQVNMENLGDKQYWAGSGGRLAAGAPRTVKLSVKVEL
ncbi:TonB-dependent siderophore receptor [Rugamonas rubra]|uniref:Iron complex outermembrane recepter protein n=1 Tax=Rugamonas rubra TaxID=758825 RepID=A0A1I4SY06_9BURK|nr:TonB-dependent siderophore receptor [Rugamonas rubra]SFM69287.1 iron complex outermembrane recepter protein [Rugamonas rubra]